VFDTIHTVFSPASFWICCLVSEERLIGIMASILAARKLAQYDGGKRVPATMSAISDAIRWAEEIMKEIDERGQLAEIRLCRETRREKPRFMRFISCG